MTPKLSASVVGGGNGGKASLEALQTSDRFDLVAAADLQPAVGGSGYNTATGVGR